MKIKYPLLFEPYYQEHLYATKVLLHQPQVRLNQLPVVYEENFLRDLGDHLCSLQEAGIKPLFELLQSFVPPEQDPSEYFVLKTAEADPRGRQAASLKFNLNAFSVEQLEKICSLVKYGGLAPVKLESA